jgi:hypothetical protein
MARGVPQDVDLEHLFCDTNHDSDQIDLIGQLDSYLRAVETDMDSWLHRFNWDKQTLLDRHRHGEELPLRTCPFNPAHAKIKERNFAGHAERCRLKSLGLSAQDIVRA